MDENITKPDEKVDNEQIHNPEVLQKDENKLEEQDAKDAVNTSIDSPNVSEYESVDSVGSSNEDGGEQVDTEPSDNEQDNQDSGSDGSVILEREEGDGQESVPVKKIDDDEDKKNPQYIPKRGTFYEHDDRTLEDSDKEESVEKLEKQNKKNVWIEKKERWSHDRYNDGEQAPKSRAELVAIYGYDIRNEDGPPRARRRRRYGRGPNKYTRTWEDEDAYKPAKVVKNPVKKIRKKTDEDYSSLDDQTNMISNENQEVDINNRIDNKYPHELTEENLMRDDAFHMKPESIIKNSNSSLDQSNRSQQQRAGTGRIVKPKPENKKEIKDSDYRGFTKSRQYKNSKSEEKIISKSQKKDRMQSVSSKTNSIQEIERDINKMSIQDSTSKNNKYNSQRQASVPPRLQNEQKGSKRYSSLRQRSLPETSASPFSQATNYYANDYNQQNPTTQQPILTQSNPIAGSTPVPQIAPPPLQAIPQQVPVTATPILQAPPQFAASFPPAPPPFLPPTVPPPPFLPQQPPQLLNYVQGQQFTQPPYQGYQHQQFNTVTQPAELYQCQGGTTYYSTQIQHIGQRAVPLKRPKAAIPIVPPPPQEPRGRGRSTNQSETLPIEEEICEAVSSENINFVDVAVQQY